jgi:hypothetical protein
MFSEPLKNKSDVFRARSEIKIIISSDFKLLRRIVFGSMSMGCSRLECVALGSAFLCFGRVVELICLMA